MTDAIPGTARGPLEGLMVLDLTRARAGPACVRHLADWGADVIRIQPPEEEEEGVIGRRDGSDFQNLHRNKRAMCLDLKRESGYATFLKLVGRADVLVENMRVPVKHRLRISFQDLKKINPRLVYGSISGFGQSGPYADRAGVDQIAQGMGGLMSVTGEPEHGPMRAGIAVADLTAGNLLALAIMMALFERNRTGEGSWVHTSLIESQLFMLDFQAARWLMDNEVPAQAGNNHPTIVPTGVFPTSDGVVNIAGASAGQWRSLCEALGKPEWLDRVEWQTRDDRAKRRDEIHEAIAGETRWHPSRHWIEKLNGAGLPCGPVYRVDEAFSDPQVQHLALAVPVDHPTRGRTHLVGSPLSFEGRSMGIRSPAPTTGLHTESILQSLGYDDARIRQMKEDGVI